MSATLIAGACLRAAVLATAHAETAAAGACSTCGHAKATGLWLTIGFVGQAVFTARFLAQWIASEKQRNSVVPVVFWWLSMVGGMLLLSYAVSRQDPVIIVGQSMGVFIYVRNLMLVAKGRKRAEREARRAAEPPPVPTAHPPHAAAAVRPNVRVDAGQAIGGGAG